MLSHLTAAELWKLDVTDPDRVHVTCFRRLRRGAKDRALRKLGLTVLRFTWQDLVDGTAERELTEFFEGWTTSAAA